MPNAPRVVPATNVVVAVPAAEVTAFACVIEPSALLVSEKSTMTPGIGAPFLVTVAVMFDCEVPSAGTLAADAVILTQIMSVPEVAQPAPTGAVPPPVVPPPVVPPPVVPPPVVPPVPPEPNTPGVPDAGVVVSS